ncbi:ABC-type nitrate/sulfonate/bicarbonate transport system substrate-binding protein [Paraburkholderia bannensis]|uniref:ABC-type nitrate/sulfonate/bicarbonate transport system substrate-binding protein n=1 Tax=Paraburkholderia bannensis TaxID=765414 RepID=A0A7W9TXZ0_9BURK|nr:MULTISPECIES: ABC transporter substrate-binding protein [Paraburkholderia]MBB3257209.1 ABC-type nitrate/sulfonate/bicarbonate transport system substrate-binding protein [Paraburkholderia sp. WP4_3_2]MBB6102395.1 ABC-type nitrate/sulfonate/bicarbonate transport system substrate-binding protein [Paraburkholderia bannensis]
MAGSSSTSFRLRRRLLGAIAATPVAALGAAGTAYAAGAADLSGLTLVLGDQAGGLRALAEASRVLEGTPYTYRWANFQGAAPLFEAQRANAVDIAPAGDLPVLAAATGDPSLRIVATRVGSARQLGILVPQHSTITEVAQLKGRTVFVSSARGSISEYQLDGALAEAGISRADVQIRYILPVDAFAAFTSGSIEAWATFDPYYGIAASRGGRVLRDGSGINSGLGFITASGAAHANPLKRAAIADLLLRLQRAGDWALAHPQDYAEVYSKLTRTPPDTALTITQRASLRQRFVTTADIATLQKVADVAVRDGILPRPLDVASLADTHIGVA